MKRLKEAFSSFIYTLCIEDQREEVREIERQRTRSIDPSHEKLDAQFRLLSFDLCSDRSGKSYLSLALDIAPFLLGRKFGPHMAFIAWSEFS